jgi:hypothetical protein
MRKLFVSLFLLAAGVHGEDFVFATDAAEYTLGSDGVSKSLIDKQTGAEWLAPNQLPMFVVKVAGKEYAPSKVTQEDDVLRATFGASGVSADFRISAHAGYLLVELVAFAGQEIEEIRIAQMRVLPKAEGTMIAVRSNGQFTISLMGFSDKVDARASGDNALVASVYPQFGMLHEKVAIVAVPTPRFYAAVQAVERDGQLPSPRIGGTWAKLSPDVRTSYMFVDLTEANVGEIIRYAKLGGFRYILVYASTWASSNGSYPINPLAFPNGERGLKAVIDKCHAAGLKVGMHMLTSFIDKRDPLVHPRPDPRLLKDASSALASAIGATSAELNASDGLTGFGSESALYGGKAGRDIQIDDEIVQYRSVSGSKLLGCLRGFAGTQPAPHRAGAKIYHLAERFSSYLVDLNTPLKDVLSERIGGLINRCGFDMIYFDGGEVNGASGPDFHYVGLQQRGIYERVRRDLLYQGSGMSPYSWHLMTRGACDDFSALDSKQFLDVHKIGLARTNYVRSFMPSELGWWGFLAAAPDHPPTMPDDVEFYAVRMLALDSPVSLETNLQALHANARTEELLRLLGGYESLRLSGQTPQWVRDRLKTGEWHMIQRGGKPEFHPVRYTPHEVSAPAAITLENEFESQPFKFRLQVLPALAPAGDQRNVTLYRSAQGLVLQPPDAPAKMPGALAARLRLAASSGNRTSALLVGAESQTAAPVDGKPVNLLHNRVLAVTLDVAGPISRTGPPAVLGVQLETGTKTYREFYVNLDFTGERTVRLAVPEPGRMLSEFPALYANYDYKLAMYSFRWDDIEALNFRWMRRAADQPVRCTVKAVEALAETDSLTEAIGVSAGGASVVIPAGLKTGDYAEYRADGVLRIFDQNGNLHSTVPQSGAGPSLQSGQNQVTLKCSRPARLQMTEIVLGPALTH